MRFPKTRWWIPISLVILVTAVSIALFLANRDEANNWELFAPVSFSRAAMPQVAQRLPSVEEYDHVKETGFVETSLNRLSTFSIDVDTASYSNIRRLLNNGERPPEAAVRIEEMLNYFSYSYPEPREDQPFSLTSELGPCPWTPANRLLRIGLKSRAIETRNLPPSHLTFLIDVSGSMMDPAKLPMVKRSFALLIEQLRPQDLVAIAVYAGAAGLVLPATPGSQKTVIQDALDQLEAGGSTAGGEGIKLAYATARRMYRQDANNRVILATDGDFNVGVSSDSELVRLIESERDHGVFLTVLGYGMGNLKDSKLEKLADHGNGSYAYVDSLLEARRVFVEQLGATLQTVAKDVKLQVDFNPARIASYRLIGYENRRLTAEEFHDDKKDAGDLGAGHSVTAFYELVPNGAGPLPEDSFQIQARYKLPQSNQSTLLSFGGSAETETPSADLRFAAAVAQFGLQLSNSKNKGQSSLSSVLALAESSLNGDAKRAEFVALVKKASTISSSKMPDQAAAAGQR